ncbi:MAG: chorismate mutase [Firmicutes bacterium]|nr:chorismate mutase [Bacillota bacterium]
MERLIAIRGATTIEVDTKEEIEKCSIELFNEIILKNNIDENDIVSIQITTTQDIVSYYPATALRLNGCKAPLFSSLEPPIKETMNKCIRFLILSYSAFKANHIYLKNAINLKGDTK